LTFRNRSGETTGQKIDWGVGEGETDWRGRKRPKAKEFSKHRKSFIEKKKKSALGGM